MPPQSEENSERFRHAVEAFNRSDVDAMVDLLHTEIEWHPTQLASSGGARPYYRGHQGLRDLVDDLERAGIQVEVEFSRIDDLVDHLIAVGTIRSRNRTGAETEQPLVYRVEIADDLARHVRAYADEESARAEARPQRTQEDG